jgi:4-amino-4-deoxychorismate lyase
MYRLFETIRIFNGVPENIYLHNERMNRSRKTIFSKKDNLNLGEYITVPLSLKEGTVKCRIIYSESVISVEFSNYVPADVKTLRRVDAGTIEYDHKYLDRSRLISLIDKGVADDILIIRNGCVTDTSYSNIVFTDGKKWITPDTPLLPGTMREYLLRKGVISQERITVNDISRFTHFRLINAMLMFEAPLNHINCIH